MKQTSVLASVLAIGVLAIVPGCGTAISTGDLDNLTVDANNNGYPDVEPPEGITFSTLDNVNVGLTNTITSGDVATIAANAGVDASLLNLVTIVANMTMTLDYGNGIIDVLNESETLEPFSKKFEIAAPESVDVAVNVVVNVPLAGPQTVTNFNLTLTRGVEYEAGQTIEVTVSVDESGNPDVDMNVT